MSWTRLSLRREVLLLLPVAMLLLVLVSTFTLLSYRNAVQEGIDERRGEAARMALALSDFVTPRGSASALELLARAPGARSVFLLDAEGRSLQSSGDLSNAELAASVLERALTEPLGVGPVELADDAIIGVVPLEGRGQARFLRLDVPDGGLGNHRRSLRLLSIIVLSVNGAVSLLVFFFLRHLLAPWEAMLEKAREVHDEPSEEQDEIAFLLSAFDRAVVAKEGKAAASEDDIAALQRALSASLESGLLLLDRSGEVLALNPVGRQLLHVPQALGVGDNLDAVLSEHPGFSSLLRQSVEENVGIQRHELAIDTPRGARFLGVTVHLLRRDDRSVRGYLVLFADLTENRRQAEEARLEEGLAQLGGMAAGVAHELRNSLATLRGYLTLVERRPGEGELADYLAEIRRETDHLKRVLEDFLLFARPETARAEWVSLETILRRATSDPALGEPAVELHLEAPREAGTGQGDQGFGLLGDEQLLEHAFRNLLRNAQRAQEEAGHEGPVQVHLSREQAGTKVRIEDRGPGLSEGLSEKLFQPFVSEFRGGVGLGLAVSYRIVSLHGGRLRLENRRGGGARAELFFPAGRSVSKSND